MCLAIPGKIVQIDNIEDNAFRTGKVIFGGISKRINLGLVEEAVVGDYVLVHVGVAISVVDEAEAQETMKFLEGLGELGELEEFGEG